MNWLDRDICYRALTSRDARFDGRLFVGVTTTGIYCRPVCPARTPKSDHCRFFASAAAAQEAGFRPCLRCRPETAPEVGSWRGTSNTVSRALALIADGDLDHDEASVETMAERLGVGGRQLRRLFQQHLGASPLAVAQTRRVLFAKQLIQETRIPMAEVAMAAGFGSVRRFNETFRELFGRPPSALRRKSTSDGSARSGVGVTVRLRYRAPYDWASMLDHFRARAVQGVEVVDAGTYRRSLAEGGRLGTVEVRHEPAKQNLVVTVRFPEVRALPSILARVRHLFDVAADIETIDEHLAKDPFLAPLVASRPGLRVPGGWDPFELAVRAVLGQQITVAAARHLAGRLVEVCGASLPTEERGLTRAFPSAVQLGAADLSAIGMPAARRSALRSLAEAALEDPGLFRSSGSIDDAIARLSAVPGIGDWTAQYIALRALRETDAFPATDIGLLRSAGNLAGATPTPAALLRRAEAWRPWRAYAAQHLWAAGASAKMVAQRDLRARKTMEEEVSYG
jgi:AraC family transcriptional regulator of adaptative response / DNA-3-methyladenine glycosylase II